MQISNYFYIFLVSCFISNIFECRLEELLNLALKKHTRVDLESHSKI